jgi:hypothetical protein
MPKIPEHAKKVFQGEIFEVWQWEQKLYDGSSQTFEMLRRADSTIVIAVTEEKTIVITEQMQPNWERPLVSLPGGIVEHDEDALSAAKRGERARERGHSETRTSSPRPSPPSDGGEGVHLSFSYTLFVS